MASFEENIKTKINEILTEEFLVVVPEKLGPFVMQKDSLSVCDKEHLLYCNELKISVEYTSDAFDYFIKIEIMGGFDFRLRLLSSIVKYFYVDERREEYCVANIPNHHKKITKESILENFRLLCEAYNVQVLQDGIVS